MVDKRNVNMKNWWCNSHMGKTDILTGKLIAEKIFPTQIPHELLWDQSQAT
jgi:hypothetical protein